LSDLEVGQLEKYPSSCICLRIQLSSLLSKGHSIMSSSPHPKYALHKAVIRNDTDEVMRLLDGPDKVDINERDGRGIPAIHYAIHTGNMTMLKLLFELGNYFTQHQTDILVHRTTDSAIIAMCAHATRKCPHASNVTIIRTTH